MKNIAIYPGTFDPVTNGHLDIIKRGLNIFSDVIVAVAHNPSKKPLFSFDERVNFIKRSTKDFGNVKVEAFGNLLIDFVREKNAKAVIKGLRAVSDFEFEFQMALMNRRLDKSFEALYLMPSEEYSFLSSRIIKEIAHLGGDISDFVPDVVIEGLKEKLNYEISK